MSAKDIVSINPTRAAVGHGSNVVANDVAGALGPRRRNEVVEKIWCAPTVLMDGLTVANESELAGIASRPLDMPGDEGAELVAPGTISARFPKLDAVMRRQKRLQVTTFSIPAVAFSAAGIVFASWLLGWA